MKLPAPLPVLAGAAGVGGWLLGHAGRGSELAGSVETDVPTTPAPPDALAGGSSSLDWGQDLGGGGVLPVGGRIVPGDLGQSDQGQWIDTGPDPFNPPVQSSAPPPPGPTPTPAPQPAPAPAPAPAPTILYYNRPPGSPPAGATGWVYLKMPLTVYDTVSSSGTVTYPVRLKTGRPLEADGARWVNAANDGILPNGSKIRIRRFSRVNLADWSLRNFYRDGAVPVHSLSTTRVPR